MGNCLVSICIPTINRLQYLRSCLESVRAQTYGPIEIVISDNGSNDGTREWLSTLEGVVVKLQDRNVGMVANWNAALRLATGQFCVLLSDDDVLDSRFVEHTVRPLADPTVEFAYTPVSIIDSDDKVVGQSASGPASESGSDFARATMVQRRVPYPSALIFRRQSASAVGYFEDIGNQADVAFRIALAELRPRSRVACINEPLVKYRVHSNSLTDDPEKRLGGRAHFKKWVARRYTAARTEGRLAVLDLLNLRSRGISLSRSEWRSLVTAGSGWFKWRAMKLADAYLLPRGLTYLVFPILAIFHTAHTINNRRFHKRFIS